MNTTANTLIELNTPRFLQIIMAIAFVVIFLLGTVGNVLVIYVLGKRKKKVIIFFFCHYLSVFCFFVINVNCHFLRKTVTFSGSKK